VSRLRNAAVMLGASLAMAGAAAVGGAAAGVDALTNPGPRGQKQRREQRGGGERAKWSGNRRWPGRGWSVAHDKRTAAKRRAVARNRRAQR
jgi:hypothetical protein